MAKGKLIVFTGPSASGKSAIAAEILHNASRFTRLVTCTTRPPRPNETDGIDYHFLDKPSFEQAIQAGEFFEWANVYGEYYGSRTKDVQSVLQTGKHAVVILDAQGASTVHQALPDAVIIFIKVPLQDLRSRMLLRQGFTKEQLQTRLDHMEKELQLSSMAQYIVENPNGHLAEAVLKVQEYLKLF